ncbi:MAG TPA: hypothetical protein VFP50_01020 [Anaeromyxobacteraceae bacterium]|nr:hypothetical protein [Anaeromyxobacteraceae bacterium]
MPTCEEQEIAIDMRLHGALDECACVALDAHLSTCERCRAFESAARRTEAIMHEGAQAAMDVVDWGAVDKAIAGWRWRSVVLVAALVAFVTYMAFGLAGGEFSDAHGPTWSAMLAALVAAVLGADVWHRARAFTRLRRDADTLAMIREDLENRGRVLTRGLLLFPLLAMFFGWRALGGDEEWASFVPAGLCVATTAFIWFVKRPALARARAALGRPEGR